MTWYYMTVEQAAKNEIIRPIEAQIETNNARILVLQKQNAVFEANKPYYPNNLTEINFGIDQNNAEIAVLQQNNLDLQKQKIEVQTTNQTYTPPRLL